MRTFKNFLSTLRKPYLKSWGLVRAERDLSWIDSTASVREVPAGVKDGSNLSFTLSSTGSMVHIYWRGLYLKEGVGYTLSGTNLTMASGYAPQADDEFVAVIEP